MYSSLVDDSSHYLGDRESRTTYIANRLCFGFEAYEGACERELEPGHTLCSRGREVEQAYRDDAEEDARRKRRWRAGLFTDEEKEIVRETLNDAERFEFDQKCAMGEFLEGLRTCVRSQAEFVLAELREDPHMLNVAAEVTLWRNGRFQTVTDIVDQCANHRWNAAIYEMWVLETACRVRGVIRRLNGVAAHALTVYAKIIDFYDPDPYEGDELSIFRQDEE